MPAAVLRVGAHERRTAPPFFRASCGYSESLTRSLVFVLFCVFFDVLLLSSLFAAGARGPSVWPVLSWRRGLRFFRRFFLFLLVHQ